MSHEKTIDQHDEGIIHGQIMKAQVDLLNREIDTMRENIAMHKNTIDPEEDEVVENRIFRAQVDTLLAGLLFAFGVNGLLRRR